MQLKIVALVAFISIAAGVHCGDSSGDVVSLSDALNVTLESEVSVTEQVPQADTIDKKDDEDVTSTTEECTCEAEQSAKEKAEPKQKAIKTPRPGKKSVWKSKKTIKEEVSTDDSETEIVEQETGKTPKKVQSASKPEDSEVVVEEEDTEKSQETKKSKSDKKMSEKKRPKRAAGGDRAKEEARRLKISEENKRNKKKSKRSTEVKRKLSDNKRKDTNKKLRS